MAGVIASVSLQQEGKFSLQKQLSVHKSNYIIPAFDHQFQPSKHNVFYKRFVIRFYFFLIEDKSLLIRRRELYNSNPRKAEVINSEKDDSSIELYFQRKNFKNISSIRIFLETIIIGNTFYFEFMDLSMFSI